MAEGQPAIIDCDGHLMESIDEMAEFLEPSIRKSLDPEYVGNVQPLTRTAVFGTLDGLHFPRIAKPGKQVGQRRPRVNASNQRMGSPDDWVAFLDKSGMKHTVLFTTCGLQIGQLRAIDYTASLCRSYNDYVASCYSQRDSRVHPIALIPMQDPPKAVAELRRAVKKLGMIGAMIPSTGLPLHLGHEHYWPIYEEAANLGCVLGVHGGSNRGIGLDTFVSMEASHILHHPVPLMYAFASFAYDGVFDRFPSLRSPSSKAAVPGSRCSSTGQSGKLSSAKVPSAHSQNT